MGACVAPNRTDVESSYCKSRVGHVDPYSDQVDLNELIELISVSG